MTDTNSLIPNQTAVSSDCLYTLKPSSVRARSYRASVPSSNKSSFAPQEVAIFYVPGGRRNTYLDTQQTYIRFTVQNNDTTVATNCFFTDQCGACFINRIDIFHASNLIETVQAYNVLFNYLLDFMFTPSAKQGLSALYGTSKAVTYGDQRRGAALYATVSQRLTFCMPLISGTLGMGSEKLLPIGALSDDIRLELTWEQQNVAVCYNTTTANTAWSIISAELELTIIELSDEGQSMVESVTPFSQQVYIHGNSWRHYMATQAAQNGGQLSMLVPARFASLKTLVLCPRRSTEMTIANAYSLSSRINPNLTQYWWRVGAYIIPNKMVNIKNSNSTGGYSEAYCEIVRSFHSLTAPQYAAGVQFDYYNTQDAANDVTVGCANSATVGGLTTGNTNLNSYQNAFAIAQELESWASRSDILISGMNTLASQIFFEANIDTVGPTAAYTFDFFANYDQILVLQNGLLSAKF
jgi:hypothetical protein